MARRHPRWRVIGAVLVLTVVSAGIASVTHVERAAPRCAPGETVAVVGGVELCSHGPDAGDLGAPDAAPSVPEATPRSIACIGNGTSGARVQAVYARPQGRADRYATLLPELRAAAAEVEHIVARSAAQTGGERHVRWVTSSRATSTACVLDVVRITVPTRAVTDFGSLVTSLDAQGLDRHDRKYLVWVDSATTTCSGIATQLDDDRPGQENFNNTSVGYARVDDSCLARDGAVEAHELFHLLGAVQRSAPHASASGHCSDEWDLLCYDDDGATGSFRTSVRCPTRAHDRRLDCRHDDYFSTHPAPGSYLDTHWNAADSRFLEPGPVVVPDPGGTPPTNDAFAAAPLLPGYAGTTPGTLAGATLEDGEPVHAGDVTGSTWYKWRPRVSAQVSVDTRGSAGDTVLAIYTGDAVAGLTRVGGNDDALDLAPQSRVTFPATSGTTYRIAVSGRSGSGSGTGTEAGTTLLRWGPPPHGATDVPPGARAESAVGWAVAFDVLPRFADRSWRPRRTVTRGQAITTLWRMLGSPPAPSGEASTRTTAPSPSTTTDSAPTTARTPTTPSPQSREAPTTTTMDPASGPTLGPEPALTFTDVSAASPARPALGWAVAAGVVAPTPTFRPGDALVRADLVTWSWAVAGRPAATEITAFTDVPTTARYRPALEWAVEHGLVVAYGDGSFRPTATVPRARLATGLFALAQDRSAWASIPGGGRPAASVY